MSSNCKYGIFWLLFAFSRSVTAQSDSLQHQINEQVWKPFVVAFKNDDTKLMQAIHSKDLIRVVLDQGEIFGYEKYFQEAPDSIKARWKNWQKTIELRFIQRLASDGKAFEVGYYKTTSINRFTGAARTSYGKFHVLLQKEDGTWKILMDEDARENTTERIFMSGKPLG